ncbi:YjjG family noncanonical pyrimidine nucleotidase [Flagellimonas meridianipacifica]|uniref:Putative hydrolase of the HAD superfamily n=1 Tax=Flagellimonas meridianipacifica TaxID=1080225 RepID=A0A2T0M852_9FLAO|nr:YjjG family noncanonical pyrimidine nucleotidase [Allomuricauda pacifica]PRX53684.1 putative hydrolase of the HAD superfamily [Allomuricauda pacifica]
MFEGVEDIFFDLDHTLWDFELNSALTFKKILVENEVDVEITSFLEVYRPINLSYWKVYRENRISKEDLRYNRLKETFDALGYEASDELIFILSERYINYLSTFGNLIPNARQVLEYLAPKYNLHIITNGFRETQRSKIRNSNIQHFFNEIIDSETAGVKKPHPQIFEAALKLADTSAKRSLMIGDNREADIMGAQALGMQALHFNFHNEPKHQLCRIINNLDEIKNLL